MVDERGIPEKKAIACLAISARGEKAKYLSIVYPCGECGSWFHFDREFDCRDPFYFECPSCGFRVNLVTTEEVHGPNPAG
jgi:DNA-directed RNA polymerase subunit RPC12/RpoP